ncbi:MAG: serine hydrolase [Leptospira sp.]|nr:serine hydrolase [Leptospira sp.]
MRQIPYKLNTKLILKISLVLSISFTLWFFNDLKRLTNVIYLFDKNRIVNNFRNMDSMFDSRIIRKSTEPKLFKHELVELPEYFLWKDKKLNTKEFLKDTWTTGLLILKNDKIIYEKYDLGNNVESKTIVWSVTKSIVSGLLGIALKEKGVNDLSLPITKFIPELKKSGYDKVPIIDLLHMTSGISFNEDYGDFFSDINRMGRALALKTSMKDFVLSLKSKRPPGEYRHYVSMDTQVLGMLVENLSGENLSDYLSKKIWEPAGMESDAYWLIDSDGKELGFAMLNMTLRDMAKIGYIYSNEGYMDKKQIIPREWIYDSIKTDLPILKPGKNPNADVPLGYGYQWWIPEEPDGDFFASGVYLQFIYVNLKHKIVIAKTSAYPNYTKDGFLREQMTHRLFQELSKELGVK